MDDRLRNWVAEAAGGAVVREQRHLRGGSRPLWFVEVERDAARRPVVVRIEGGALAGTELSLAREAEIYRALAPTPVPTPELLAVRDDGTALLLEHLRGRAGLPADRDEAGSVLESFIDVLATLHSLDPVELRLPDAPRDATAGAVAAAELDRWESLAGRLDSPDPLLALAVSWLRRHPPLSGREPVLVQGDTGPGNFLHEHGRVTGIVDLELAHLADPMADVAWLDFRCAGVDGPFGDVARRDRLYEAATGTPIDRQAVRRQAVLVRYRCAVLTGLAMTLGGAPLSTVTYRAPHHRFLVELAAALGVAGGHASRDLRPDDVDELSALAALPTGDQLDDVIDADRSALTGADEAEAKLLRRVALIEHEHERAVAHLDAHLGRAELDDRRRTLGTPATDDRLRALAGDAESVDDPAFLALLSRRAWRRGLPWWTPVVGGAPSAPAAPRPW